MPAPANATRASGEDATLTGKVRVVAVRAIGSAIEELPHVLDPVRIPADQQGYDVSFQIGHDGHLAPVQRGVTETTGPVGGGDLQGDEVSARTGHDDARIRDGRRRARVTRMDMGNVGRGAIDHARLQPAE